MAAEFVSQQYLQNVLGYSTLEAGSAILPAVVFMVLVAPRSAKLVEARGARFTLLVGYVFLLLTFLSMLLLWKEDTRTGRSASHMRFIGIGVGFAGTPASHSLTGSVPVRARGNGLRHGRPAARPGRRDHAIDLRRAAHRRLRGGDVGSDRRTRRPQITDSTQSQLTKSFAGAEVIAEQHPQYASQITAAAKKAFLDGGPVGLYRRPRGGSARRSAGLLPLPEEGGGAAVARPVPRGRHGRRTGSIGTPKPGRLQPAG